MPGVWLVACSLALTGSRACVPVYMCSLCMEGALLFTALGCQLGTKSQEETVHTCTYTHTRAHAHSPPSAVFLSSSGRELKEVREEYRGRGTNEGQQQFRWTLGVQQKKICKRYKNWDKKITVRSPLYSPSGFQLVKPRINRQTHTNTQWASCPCIMSCGRGEAAAGLHKPCLKRQPREAIIVCVCVCEEVKYKGKKMDLQSGFAQIKT